jgi:putative phosphoesterase
MRILLIADVHANWPALRAINEPYDVCLCLGDLVDYGLQPSPCIAWVKEHARYTVRGNHDHGAAQNVTVNGQSGFKYLTGITRPLTRQLLSTDELKYLGRLPVTQAVTLDHVRYFMVHATPRDPLDEYAAGDPEQWARRLEQIDADVVCVGHTHVPYVLEINGKVVVNPGSVGVPRDGDPRAAYAILQGTKVELKRVEYPVEESVKVIEESTLPDMAKQLLIQVFRTGQARRESRIKEHDTKVVPDKPGSKMLKPSDPGTQPKPPIVRHETKTGEPETTSDGQ